MIVQCCVCKKVRENGLWTFTDQVALDRQNVSHGYCPQCAANAFAQLSVTVVRTAGESARKSSAA